MNVIADVGSAVAGDGWRIYGQGDFDADGTPDLAWSTVTDSGDGKDDLVWRRNNDTGEPRVWMVDSTP